MSWASGPRPPVFCAKKEMILRKGEKVGDLPAAALTVDEAVKLMVGGEGA